jgi:DNA-binding XRE family transcriptional regulator
MIYFVQSESGLIKIGHSSSVKTRLVSLQVDNPERLTLLAEIKGSRKTEQEIHNKFSHLKVRGEWFKSDKQIFDFIAEMSSIGVQEAVKEPLSTPPNLSNILISVGENIRLARLRRNLSAQMVAERAGITRTTLRAVETGNSGVSFRIVAMVLFVLNLEKDLLALGLDDVLGRKLQDLGLERCKRKTRNKS